MKWDKLLNDKRRRESGVTRSKNTDVRSAFENDFQRIVMSASFRRLQDKTQVFPLEKSDFVRTRLTHSMEVSTIAKSMGNMVTHTIQEENLDQDFTKDHAEKFRKSLLVQDFYMIWGIRRSVILVRKVSVSGSTII